VVLELILLDAAANPYNFFTKLLEPTRLKLKMPMVVKLQAGNCGAAPAQLVLTAAATQFHVFG
jgi:hypothetical protein